MSVNPEIMRALDFAARQHVDQRRKGDRAEPYVNHLLEVAHLLAWASDGKDDTLVLGGILHDVVEDTEVTLDQVEAEFGRELRDLVSEVTDDKSLPKAERKRLQIASAPDKSERARMIKIADKVSNLRAIQKTPPPDWSWERKREYFSFAESVCANCRGVNERLDGLFSETYQAGLSSIGDKAPKGGPATGRRTPDTRRAAPGP